MTVHLTDRSRSLAGQRCPRERFMGYHFNGVGLQKIGKSLPLMFGSSFHEGAAWLLGGKLSSSIEEHVEAAVTVAKTFLNEAWSESSIDLSEEAPNAEALKYTMAEQNALAEAFLRGWYVYAGEEFLSRYEVIDVEAEGRAELAPGIILLFRPDAVVRERATGDIYIVSWKTASTYGRWTTEQMKIDTQSMSESWGVSQMTGLRIEGVLYIHLLKGQRRLNSWNNRYEQGSHLVYAWQKPIPGEDDFDWSWAYAFPNEADPEKESKLGKGWRKVSVWDNYPGGVKAWIEALSRNEIFPRHGEHPLAKVFPVSLPVERRADEIERWRRQTVSAERKIAESLEKVQGAIDTSDYIDVVAEVLDDEFPQYTHSCYSFSRACQFMPVCFGPSVGADPLASGLYQIRIQNHPEHGDDE